MTCHRIAPLLSFALLISLAGCGDDGSDGTGGGTSTTGGSTTEVASSSSSTTSSDEVGSSSSGGSDSSSSTGTDAGDPLELLDEGPHLGMIVGFEPPAPGTEDTVDGLWNDAIDAGMDIARIQVDWADLEPRPGVYELEEYEAMLIDLEAQGLQVMVTLSTIDSFEFTMPEDLEDPQDPLALADGMTFDDPVVVERFSGLLDAMVPMTVEHGGFLITVGNEGDNAFEDLPGLASEIAGFTAAAKAHTAVLDPGLEISTTLTYASASNLADLSAQIIDAVDVVTFNLYCESEETPEITEETVRDRIQAVLEAANGKPVVIQELGCSTGYTDQPSVLNNSPEIQRMFFEVFAQAMRDEPQLRTAFIFQMLDWSPGLVQLISDEMEALGFAPAIIQWFAEALATVGLCRWTDATCGPAWEQVLDDLATL